MYKNIIVIPPFYEGTSFEEIFFGLSYVIRKKNLPITFVGNKKALKNNLAGDLLDDRRYLLGQIEIIKKIIKCGKIKKILFLDFFNPGMDLVRYYHEQQNIKVKYGSLFHGGCFLKNDLYSFSWLNKFENAWFGLYDIVYTSSKYTLKSCPRLIKDKFKVLPWGLDGIDFNTNYFVKEWDVVFPHRLNSDKGVEDLLKIIKALPGVSFAVTIPQELKVLKKNRFYRKIIKNKNVTFVVNESRVEHLKTLSRARIVLSCAKQELFGYSVMKGVLSGCIPLLPNALCYPEYFDKEFMYNDIDEAVNMVKSFLEKGAGGHGIQKINELRARLSVMTFEKILFDFFS